METNYPKNLKQLKEFISIGQVWDLENPVARFYPGPRELVHKDTVGFGFRSADGRISYCNWPKSTELMFVNNHNGKLQFRIDFTDDDGYLFYTLIN